MKQTLFGLVIGALLVAAGMAYATRDTDAYGQYIYTTTKTATIAISTTTSAEIDIEDFALVGILMPSAFTGSALTFKCSNATGGTFYDVYNDSGTQVSWTVAASRFIEPATQLRGCRFVKVVSGSSEAAARTLQLVLGR